LAGVLSTAGCDAASRSTVDDVVVSTSALTASVCALGASCELRLFLPKGLKTSETVVVAEQSLTVSDRAEVRLNPSTFRGLTFRQVRDADADPELRKYAAQKLAQLASPAPAPAIDWRPASE